MRYHKPSLTFAEQAELLPGRGLMAPSREAVIKRLQAVSYYRLSAYWYPFRLPDDTLRPGTTLDMVWRRYTFDRQLRLLLIDAIERAEIAVRTQLVYHHTQLYGPFGYCDPGRLGGISGQEHADLLARLREEAERSREDFVEHFRRKYNEERNLPLWMACELMTFGNMLTLFRGAERTVKQAIAGHFGVADTVLESWLRALNQVRNICAHHGRMWNRVLGLKPAIPRANKHPEWHTPATIPNERVFGILTVLQYFLRRIAPHSAWKQHLLDLFARYPDISLTPMGFPPAWQQSPIWT